MMIAEKDKLSANNVDMMRVINCITLVSKVRSEGYAIVESRSYGADLAYVRTLDGKTTAELYNEMQRLRALLMAIHR